jgi:hypothetical protein
MTKDQLASLAASLRDNEAFQFALDNQRSSALEALAVVSVLDVEAINKHQATVRVVDEIRADLDRFIRSGQPRVPPGIA